MCRAQDIYQTLDTKILKRSNANQPDPDRLNA